MDQQIFRSIDKCEEFLQTQSSIQDHIIDSSSSTFEHRNIELSSAFKASFQYNSDINHLGSIKCSVFERYART